MANAITPLIQQYTVDFASSNNFVFVKGIQGDGYGTRYVDIALLNDTQPYLINSDAVVVVIRGTKPDNKAIFNECEILNNNTIRAEITQQMSAVAGKGDYEISIMDKVENRTLTSFPFFIMISKSSFDIGYVLSSDEFGLLISKINQVDKMEVDVAKLIEDTIKEINSSKAQTEKCKTATNDAINATNSLREFHNEASEAENQRIANENKRQQDTATAITNTEKATQDAIDQTTSMQELEQSVGEAESERVLAENDRIQQALDFANKEAIRQANEIVRINDENTRKSSEIDRESKESVRELQEQNRETLTQTAISEANEATSNANTAATYANSVGNDLTERLRRGEFKGEKGDNGVVATISGKFAFQIVNDHLIVFYDDQDDPPNFSINDEGHLIYTFE